MPNITRGRRLGGLMQYLVGPGRSDEHTEPHLVAGDPAIMAWHDTAELDGAAAREIASALDRPRQLFGTEIPDGHVWHCSLSLRASEGVQSDEKWAELSSEFVEGMGFTGGGKADVRWVAVRHGLSTNGNDHVHIVVNLVREDGTKANPYRDRVRAQRLAGELERKHGLEVLEERGAGRGERSPTRAEVERAAREGRPEPHRKTLGRIVRAAATASENEAEFVRRMRRSGVLVDGRIAAGTSDVITGYSVALRPVAGERPLYVGGRLLAKDLSLDRLRQGWPDSPEHASAAAAEWIAAKRGRRPVAPGREVEEVTDQQWHELIAQQSQMSKYLSSVPVDDWATWSRVASETSGAFAAWSRQVEATPGPLAEVADSLARSAQVRGPQTARPKVGTPSMRGAAMLLSSVAHGGQGTVAQAVLFSQLRATVKAMRQAHEAVGDARRAAEIERVMGERLAGVRAGLPKLQPKTAAVADPAAAEAKRVASIGRRPFTGADLADRPGSVLPARLTPSRQEQDAERAGRGSDLER
ncbi:relaxase/mobilization nuclease domain-containing protein [Modestobacter muralis]|nr:relaxase/mobilization nuclease domain-containing protein [Modestobacter muralis]